MLLMEGLSVLLSSLAKYNELLALWLLCTNLAAISLKVGGFLFPAPTLTPPLADPAAWFEMLLFVVSVMIWIWFELTCNWYCCWWEWNWSTENISKFNSRGRFWLESLTRQEGRRDGSSFGLDAKSTPSIYTESQLRTIKSEEKQSRKQRSYLDLFIFNFVDCCVSVPSCSWQDLWVQWIDREAKGNMTTRLRFSIVFEK